MPNNYAEVGHTGLNRFRGTILEEFLHKLQGARGMAIFREMADNEPIVGSFLFGTNMIIRQAPWEIRAADDSPKALEIAEFFREVLFEDMETPFPSVLTEVLTMLQYGWSALEICLKERRGPDAPFPHESKFTDNKVGVRALYPRSQDSLHEWLYNERTNRLQGFTQVGRNGEHIDLPIAKLLHFRTMSVKDNPEGFSFLRRAVKPYFRKKGLEESESIGVERNLAGYPVVKVPGEILDPNATGDAVARKSSWEKFVRDIRMDEQMGALIPSDVDPETKTPLYEIVLLSASGSKPADSSPIIERYSTEILQSVLFDIIKLGHEQFGSFALADSKTEMFALALAGILDEVASPFNRTLFPKLMKLNGFDLALTPILSYGDIEKQNAKEWAEALKNIFDSGIMFTDPVALRYARELLGIPEQADGEAAELVPTPDPTLGVPNGNGSAPKKPDNKGNPKATKPTTPAMKPR